MGAGGAEGAEGVEGAEAAVSAGSNQNSMINTDLHALSFVISYMSASPLLPSLQRRIFPPAQTAESPPKKIIIASSDIVNPAQCQILHSSPGSEWRSGTFGIPTLAIPVHFIIALCDDLPYMIACTTELRRKDNDQHQFGFIFPKENFLRVREHRSPDLRD